MRARGAGGCELGSRGGSGEREPRVTGEGWSPGVGEDGNVSVLTLVIRPSLSPDSVEWEGRSLLKALIKKAALG